MGSAVLQLSGLVGLAIVYTGCRVAFCWTTAYESQSEFRIRNEGPADKGIGFDAKIADHVMAPVGVSIKEPCLVVLVSLNFNMPLRLKSLE